MILVTGASGNAGGAVVNALLKRAAPLRAMYRNREDAAKAPSGVPVAIADFSSTESLLQALHGIETVYLVCSPIPALVELESNVIDACLQCGVRHVILNSALGAGDYPKSFPAWHRIVEDKLTASGLPFTILRPNGFMQNILLYLAPGIRAQGTFYAAMGDAGTSFIDLRDIAAAVANIALAPAKHLGRVYELNGPEAVSYPGLAERITRACGQPVNYINIPEEVQRANMLGMGMPVWQVDALLDLQRYYTSGQGAQITGVLEALLERRPLHLDAFLEEFKDSFRRQN